MNSPDDIKVRKECISLAFTYATLTHLNYDIAHIIEMAKVLETFIKDGTVPELRLS